MQDRPLRIAVIGAGHADAVERARAFEVGGRIAAAGCVLVCGGLGGVMEAASEGAARQGGVVVGVLPSNRPDDANRHVTIPVATGFGEARNAVIVNTADALIAIGGAYGTLSELAFALRAGKPVFGLSTWDIDPAVVRCEDEASAVEAALAAARAR